MRLALIVLLSLLSPCILHRQLLPLNILQLTCRCIDCFTVTCLHACMHVSSSSHVHIQYAEAYAISIFDNHRGIPSARQVLYMCYIQRNLVL